MKLADNIVIRGGAATARRPAGTADEKEALLILADIFVSMFLELTAEEQAAYAAPPPSGMNV